MWHLRLHKLSPIAKEKTHTQWKIFLSRICWWYSSLCSVFKVTNRTGCKCYIQNNTLIECEFSMPKKEHVKKEENLRRKRTQMCVCVRVLIFQQLKLFVVCLCLPFSSLIKCNIYRLVCAPRALSVNQRKNGSGTCSSNGIQWLIRCVQLALRIAIFCAFFWCSICHHGLAFR